MRKIIGLLFVAAFPALCQPISLSGFQDQGVFNLYKNEDRLATIKFQWQKDGKFENEAVISMAGQRITITDSIEVDSGGRWTKLTSAGLSGSATGVRDGDTVTRTIKDKKQTFQLKPGAVLFANYSPALISLAVPAYAAAKGGLQTFPMVILPGTQVEGSLFRRDKVERAVNGKDMVFTRYTYGVPGVDITIWADADGKIFVADVPSQYAAYVREGFESLLIDPKTDLLLSQPKFEVRVDRNTNVPMRDGVKLAADIYRPDVAGKYPVILTRTPYKKEMSEIQAQYYARRGYVYAVQDCRGRFASPGCKA